MKINIALLVTTSELKGGIVTLYILCMRIMTTPRVDRNTWMILVNFP